MIHALDFLVVNLFQNVVNFSFDHEKLHAGMFAGCFFNQVNFASIYAGPLSSVNGRTALVVFLWNVHHIFAIMCLFSDIKRYLFDNHRQNLFEYEYID